jgi:phosphate uptake regulator
MDRISALRNVEEALDAFERGDADLTATERRVRTVLQTYATEFEDENRAVYQTATDDPTVVVAASAAEARERIADLTGEEPGDVERLK